MKLVDSPKGETGERYPRRVYLALTALAFTSCLALDFLASRRGERAYLFPQHPNRRVEGAAPVSLAGLANEVLAQNGLVAGSVQVGRDEAGQPRYSVELTKDAYLGLTAPLQSVFLEHQARVRVQEEESQGRAIYSWYVQKGDQDKLTLVFSCLSLSQPETEGPPSPAPPAPAMPTAPAAPSKTAAIIIDDMGNSLEALQEIVDLGIPLTISVLPQSPYALETAQTAHDHELEVMLHLAGEALNLQDSLAPPMSVIRSEMTPDEIRAFVLDSLDRIPFVSGVNNHMGSRITREKRVMAPVFDVLKERGLFFIDSLTGNGSIAYNQAHKMGLRSAYRNVFLDSEVGAAYSRKKLVELFKLARKRGRAVAIGHPFPETLQALRENLSLPSEFGVRLVLASQAVSD